MAAWVISEHGFTDTLPQRWSLRRHILAARARREARAEHERWAREQQRRRSERP